MRALKNIVVNLLFLTFLFIVMIPPGRSEGHFGHGTFAVIMFLLSAMILIVSSLAYGIRKFAVAVRTVGGVFVGWFIYLAALFLVDRKPPIVDDIIKYWFAAVLAVALIVMQFAYNWRNVLILLGVHSSWDDKTPPIVLD